jgi:hemerythrin-like domain-containing protein
LRLFDRFPALTDDDARQRTVERACAELRLHASIEQEVVYPALRAALGVAAPLDAALADHRDAEALIEELAVMQPGDNLYEAKFIVLGEYVRHHIEVEQGTLFPLAKRSSLDQLAVVAHVRRRGAELCR